MENQKLEIRNQNKAGKVEAFILFSALYFLNCMSAGGQQPSTTTAPVFNANAKYVQGMGPGYWPTPGAQLTLNIAAGSSTCGTPPALIQYAGGTLPMTANSTNYVYLDPAQNCAPRSNSMGFAAGQIPLAKVVTNSSAITSVTDARSFFTPQPVGTDSSGHAVTKHLNNLRFADQFPGATGTAKVDAAVADIGSSPGMVIVPPGTGTGDATAYPNNVAVLDLRQTTDLIDGVSSDADRPSAILLQNHVGELTTRPYSGTVTLTHGSRAVTGVNTHFLTEIGPSDPSLFPAHWGRSIKLDSDPPGTWAEVAAVADDTHATLAIDYPGNGGTGPASYFVTEFGLSIFNVATGGLPNTPNAGESLGLSVISNRSGGERGIYGANFNVTYETPASTTQGQAIGLEIDLANATSADDNTGVSTIGLDILSGGSHRPNTGLSIGATTANNGFQRGIFVHGWGEAGMVLSGPQDHLHFFTGAAPNSNPQIGGRTSNDSGYIWQINNDGGGSFAAPVNFNGGITSTGALSLSSGANGNITLSPNGSGSVLVPGATGDNKVHFQSGPPTTSFLAGTSQDPLNLSSNNVGCLNQGGSRPYCLTVVAQSSVADSNPLGAYGIGVGNVVSGTAGSIQGVEGDAFSEGAANVMGVVGVTGFAQQDGPGTVATMAALQAATNAKTAGTVTTNFGLLVSPQSAGITNYAIATLGSAPSLFGGAISTGSNTVSYSATPAFDATVGNTQKIVLTGNVSTSTLVNPAPGEQINFVICQDGTGGRTFVWPGNVSQGPPVNPNPNACTYYSTLFDGSNANPLTASQAAPNITPVTVAGATAADQNLTSIPIPAGLLNVLGKSISVFGAGTYTTGTSGMGTMTFKVKLCAVAGCGSGTVVTLGTFGPTAAQVASSSNIPWNVSMTVLTSTVGGSGKVIPHGSLQTVLSATPTAAGVTHLTQTTGQSAAIDLTAPTFLQFTVADSGASANNSFTQTMGVIHAMN